MFSKRSVSPGLHILRVCTALIGSFAIAGEQSTTEHCYVEGLADRLRCGFVLVPENPVEPDGSKIKIHYAVIPAVKPLYPHEVFLAINGGPGQSTIDSAALFNNTFSKIRETRDILLIDQRGTGKSNLLSCPENSGHYALTMNNSSIDYAAETQKCLDQLDADVTMYDSINAVEDFETIRKSLGYKKLHLYGISYGSRMAQLYMRYYSEAVETVTLDGVVPMQQSVLAIGMSIDRGLLVVFDQCKKDDVCDQHFSNLEKEFNALNEQLTKNPISIPIFHPSTGHPESFLITRDKLLSILRLSMYSPSTRSLIPLAISQAKKKNYQPLLGLFSLVMDGIDLAGGMHNSVVCSEDIHRITPVMLTEIKQSYAANSMYQAMDEVCSIWPSKKVDEDFSVSIASDIPTLLLSGFYDPATPPEWGHLASAKMTNSVHFIAPYASHGVAFQTCGNDLIAELVDHRDINQLSESCLTTQKSMGFFINPSTRQPLSDDLSKELLP